MRQGIQQFFCFGCALYPGGAADDIQSIKQKMRHDLAAQLQHDRFLKLLLLLCLSGTRFSKKGFCMALFLHGGHKAAGSVFHLVEGFHQTAHFVGKRIVYIRNIKVPGGKLVGNIDHGVYRPQYLRNAFINEQTDQYGQNAYCYGYQ